LTNFQSGNNSFVHFPFTLKIHAEQLKCIWQKIIAEKGRKYSAPPGKTLISCKNNICDFLSKD
jgi:hypothetical protein